jgi:NTP pyrophosphatase (non-canonical NTP hydrolase)
MTFLSLLKTLSSNMRPNPEMDTKAYEQFVRDTNAHIRSPEAIGEVLEMLGEAGEVLELFQKRKRKAGDFKVPQDRLFDELSDVLWGLTAVATKMGFTLEALMAYNQIKLTMRREGESKEKSEARAGMWTKLGWSGE